MAEFITAVAQLAWPVVVLIGVVLFARPLSRLLRSGTEREDVTIELGGQRVTLGRFRQQQNEATLDLRRQLDELRRRVAGAPADPVPSETPAQRSRVLWVDDQPENNALFIDQLMTGGVVVDLARTTAEGLQLASRHAYGAVITDMGRFEEGRHRPDAGIEFVEKLRDGGDRTPALVFTSGRSARARKAEAEAAGAQAITSSGVDLTAFLRAAGVVE